MRNLKIITLTPFYGGGEKFILLLADLLKLDFKIEVISPHINQLACHLQQMQIPFQTLGSGNGIKIKMAFLLWIWNNRKSLKSQNTFILLNTRSAAFFSPLIWAISRQKAILICHTSLASDFKSRCLGWVQPFLSAKITVSDFLAESHRVRWPKMKTFSIPNWLPDLVVPTAPHEIEQPLDAVVPCIVVSRLVSDKGVQPLLAAVTHMRDIRVDVFGDGPLLPALVSEFHSDGHINMMGFRDDIKAYLYNHVIYISNSHHESYSYSLAEAIQAGLLCVVSDIPAHRELLGPNYPPLLFFRVDSAEEIRGALVHALTLLRIPKQARRVLSLAKERVMERNAPERARQSYLSVLDHCMQEKRHARV